MKDNMYMNMYTFLTIEFVLFVTVLKLLIQGRLTYESKRSYSPVF